MVQEHCLADVTRALQLESAHAGSLVIARADGTILGFVGERSRAVFPRSAIKIIQALPLIESGAADRFNLTTSELSLVCGSHSGAPFHVAIADALLRRLGLERSALACGAHMPIGERESRDLIRAGQAAMRLHNNCSGKHVGMLAMALHLGLPVKDYEVAQHQVQQLVRSALEEVTENDLSGTTPGIDGCSLPNWPLPLDNLAIAFARIVSGTGFEETRNASFRRLAEACWQVPEAMAGEGRFDTEVLRRFPGEVLVKGGAEGVYCGGIRSLGIGFALKVDDGAKRAAEMAAGTILARLLNGADDLGRPVTIENAAGIAVGDVRPGAALVSVLERISI